MKKILLMIAVVALVGGCGSTPKKAPEPTNPIVAPTSTSWVSDPSDPQNVIVEKAIRERFTDPQFPNRLPPLPFVKPAYHPPLGLTGELTKADLAKVRYLCVGDTKITDTGLKELAKLQNLTALRLHHTKITDAGLKDVAKLQQLTYLILNRTQITDAGLKELAKLQKLDYLTLGETKITDAGLKEVAKLQNLTLLFLSNTQITDAGLKDIAKLQKLKGLSLHSTKITHAGVAELKKALPKCKIEWTTYKYDDKGNLKAD